MLRMIIGLDFTTERLASVQGAEPRVGQHVPAQRALEREYGPNHKRGLQFSFPSKPTPALHLSGCSPKYKHGQLRREDSELPGVKLVIYGIKTTEKAVIGLATLSTEAVQDQPDKHTCI